MYTIEINYNTGNSLSHQSGLTDTIDLNWNNLDVVKENCKRIIEHYKWYKGEADSLFDTVEHPEWLNKDIKEYDMSLNLKLDNGTEQQIWSFWCGYFDSLNSLRIVLDRKDLEFYV